MFKPLLIFILFALLLRIRGATLYVNVATGNDNNAGTLSTKPLKTIAKATALSTPGTTILISPGIYRESIIPKSGTPSSPIIYKATTKGGVILRGSDLVGGFSAYQGSSPQFSDPNVYVAPLNGWTFTTPCDDSTTDLKTSVTYVGTSTSAKLTAAQRYFLARSPNPKVTTDWKRAEFFWRADGGSVPGDFSTTQLTDATDDVTPTGIQSGNLKSVGVNLAGASLFALDSQNSHWWWYRIIKSHDLTSGTITIDTDQSGSCSNGVCTGCQPKHLCKDANADTGGKGFGSYSKYFVENHPGLMDIQGEYYVDKTSSPPRLFLHPYGNTATSSFAVEVGRRDIGITLTGVSNVKFDGLVVEMFEFYGIYINNWNGIASENIVLTNMEISFCRNGMRIAQGVNGADPTKRVFNLEISNSLFHHIDSNGISLQQGYWSCNINGDTTCEINSISDIFVLNNKFYEIGFRSEQDSGDGAMIIGPNNFKFVNNYVHHIAHNGFQFVSGAIRYGASYPYSQYSLISSGLLVKDNIFEYNCILESDCGGIKFYGESFKNTLVHNNIARYNWGWSVAVEEQNKVPTTDPYYGPNKLYWNYRLGFAFGFYMDYTSGVNFYKNFAYDNQECYHWTARLSSEPLYFYNNLAANCYYDFGSFFSNSDHVGTYIFNNLFLSGQRHGISMQRWDGSPLAGNFFMDNNLFFYNGWDTRSDAVWRRGIADFGFQDNSIPNGGNPTRDLPGLKSWTNTNLNSIDLDPKLSSYSVSAKVTTSLYPTASGTVISNFQLTSTSPAINTGVSNFPSDFLALLTLWGISIDKVGTEVDIGPLEYGFTYNFVKAGPGNA